MKSKSPPSANPNNRTKFDETSSLMPASLKTWHSDLKFCQSLIFLDFLGASERRVVMVIMTTCAKDRPDIGPHRGASRTQGNFGWLPPRGIWSR